VLFLLIGILMYVAFVEPENLDTEYNAKRGVLACLTFFILLGVTVTPDGPFLRPHPALWRFMFCISIVYQLSLIFLLFQVVTCGGWWWWCYSISEVSIYLG
jgi:phosphatidylserine synthase 2